LTAAQSPETLLTPQRLRRLQRDRERQTERWLNFERRIQQVPDSPQRGFELALYYAVTHDASRGREAINWAVAHPCNEQDTAVFAWTSDLISQTQRSQTSRKSCMDPPNELFPNLRTADLLEVISSYLLVLRPEQVEHPTWQQHIRALALVNLEPNSQPAQFLQGWAMEDRFMLREGPGVAYEFLLGDPYLPGVSYQNMDPWFYKTGSLLARSDWSEKACWIHVTSNGIEQQNCPHGWESQVVLFGHLTLLPAPEHCANIERNDLNEAFILWKMKPDVKITYPGGDKQRTTTADDAGMWRVPEEVRGKVCVSK